jgi:demethylmenaquinone methyltransferase/2-methoxy-6-polyprenyl-1,4-benzoquinol methylase
VRQALKQDQLLGVYSRVARRYDFQHALLTLRSDERGRKKVVDHTVRPGQNVLDAGAGTGSTAILAARQVGPDGRVQLFDLSSHMLEIARGRAEKAGVADRMSFQTGDLLNLPFADDSFDAVLSTYSLCPVYDPAAGAVELYRVVKPGGHLGIAHSAEPERSFIRWLADKIEDIIWRFPTLSMGCRAVDVHKALEGAGGELVYSKLVGVPLWPFRVLVIVKPV